MTDEMRQKAKSYWYVPVILFLILHLSAITWWAASINERVKNKTSNVLSSKEISSCFRVYNEKIKALDEKINEQKENTSKSIEDIKIQLRTIDTKIDKLLFRQD